MDEDFVEDPIIELLAIKLYEHATRGNPDVKPTMFPRLEGEREIAWSCLDREDREAYRDMAKGRICIK